MGCHDSGRHGCPTSGLCAACMRSAGMNRRCLSRCAIEEFKRSSDSWRTHAQTAAAMRSEFAELLADEDTAPAPSARPAQEGTTSQAASELPSTAKRDSNAESVSLAPAATLKPGGRLKKRKKKQRADMAGPPEAAAIAEGSAEQQKPRKRRHEKLAAPSEDVLAQPDTKRTKKKPAHMLEGNGGAAPLEGVLTDPGEGQQKASRKRKGDCRRRSMPILHCKGRSSQLQGQKGSRRSASKCWPRRCSVSKREKRCQCDVHCRYVI